MVDASWSVVDGDECLRVRGVGPGARLVVRPSSAVGVGLEPPAMAGRTRHDAADVCFVPRFGFVDGTSYSVTVDGRAVVELTRPRRARPATTEVVAIHPTAHEVPRNLLRVHVEFSAPMSEGSADTEVALIDSDGRAIAHALLPGADELWDGEHRRLTLLLDPARIKRGLVAHRDLGYALRAGTTVRLVVTSRFLDATGAPLRVGAGRSSAVGDDERRLVDVAAWNLVAPVVGTAHPLVVEFDRPLDHVLLGRCLRIERADGRQLGGRPTIGPEGRSWGFLPDQPWVDERHRVVVDPRLEDLAGNSLRRVFDRDVAAASGQVEVPGPVAVGFRPGADRAE